MLSSLPSSLANQSGASPQILWQLLLRLPVHRQWGMGEDPHLTACRCGGNLGPSSFIGRVPVSSSVFPSGLPGATSLSLWGCAGWDDPLDVCPAPANTPVHLLCSATSNAFLHPLSIFQNLVEDCLLLKSFSSSLSLWSSNLFLKLSSFTVTCMLIFRGEALKACSQPTAFSWACANYLNFKILLPVLCLELVGRSVIPVFFMWHMLSCDVTQAIIALPSSSVPWDYSPGEIPKLKQTNKNKIP